MSKSKLEIHLLLNTETVLGVQYAGLPKRERRIEYEIWGTLQQYLIIAKSIHLHISRLPFLTHHMSWHF